MTKLIKIILVVLLIITAILSTYAAIYGWEHYWRYPKAQQAVIKVNLVTFGASAAEGTLKVYVKNRSLVQQRQLLCAIDPDPKRQQETEAKAVLATVTQKIKQDQARVTAAQKRLEELHRKISTLSKQGFDLQNSDNLEEAATTKVELDIVKKSIPAADEELAQAYQLLGDAKTNQGLIEAAQLKLNEAKIRTKITYIYAPVAGLVDFTTTPDTTVSAPKKLGSIIKDNAWWVEANFKPISALNIKLNQLATISLANPSPEIVYGEVVKITDSSENTKVLIKLLNVHQPLYHSAVNEVSINTATMVLPTPTLMPKKA